MIKTDSTPRTKVFFNWFLDFLFPTEESVRDIEKSSAEELLELLPRSEYIHDSISSLFAYSDERVKHLVWEIKYYQNEKIAGMVGVLIAKMIREDCKNLISKINEDILVVPVPLTKQRLNERGFNHTQMLAEAVLKNLPGNFVFSGDIVQKTRHTPKQSSIENREERFTNLIGVFEIVDAEKIRGKNVLIIDDVTTTGATLLETKRVLLLAGAKSVRAYTVAH